MNLFDRYILKNYLIILAAVSLVFGVLIAIGILVEDTHVFVQFEPSLYQIVSYVFFSLPHRIVQFIPLVVLLALVVTLHQLLKWKEITAIMAAGAGLPVISENSIVLPS